MAIKVLTKAQHAMFGSAEVSGHPHDVKTSLNYYDDPGDGTPPTPIVIGGYVSQHGCLLVI